MAKTGAQRLMANRLRRVIFRRWRSVAAFVADPDISAATNRRYVFEMLVGKRPVPDRLRDAIRKAWPGFLPPYLEDAGFHHMTQQDAELAALAAESGTKAAGSKPRRTSALATAEALEEIVGSVPWLGLFYRVWERACELERVPEGKRRLERARQLHGEVQGLLPRGASLTEDAEAAYFGGVLSALLAATQP